MTEESSFLLVSLREGKSKKLAQVISNETSRKILELLTKKPYTETEIANELQLPISTIHYNIRHLLDAGLILSEEFHYSRKGREVNHYKLSNKFIIIAPAITESAMAKLKKVLPISMIAIVAAGFIHLISKIKAAPAAQPAMPSPEIVAGALSKGALSATGAAQAAQPIWQNIALWFLAGSAFAIALFFIIDLSRKNNL